MKRFTCTFGIDWIDWLIELIERGFIKTGIFTGVSKMSRFWEVKDWVLQEDYVWDTSTSWSLCRTKVGKLTHSFWEISGISLTLLL